MRLIRKRIITDCYLGYEVQVWRWWWPFWVMYLRINTFTSVSEAEKFARIGSLVKEIDLGVCDELA